MNYYIYKHIVNNIVRYIGRGKYDGYYRRAYNKTKRSDVWKEYMKDKVYNVVIISTGLTHREANELEIELISKYGRMLDGGTLLNISKGGDSNRGVTPDEQWRKNISEAKKGKKLNLTDEERERRSKQSTLNSIIIKERLNKQRFIISTDELTITKEYINDMIHNMELKVKKINKYVNIRLNRNEKKRNKPIISKEEHKRRTIEGWNKWKDSLGEGGLDEYYAKLATESRIRNKQRTEEELEQIRIKTKEGMKRKGYNVKD